MHFRYRFTGFFILKENKLRKPRLYDLLGWAINEHKLYATANHHDLWLVQLCSLRSRLPPLMLTWFIGLLWSKHPTLWMCSFARDADGWPDRLSSITLLSSDDSGCALYSPPTSGNAFAQIWFPLPTEYAQSHVVVRWRNCWVECPYVWARCHLDRTMKCCAT